MAAGTIIKIERVAKRPPKVIQVELPEALDLAGGIAVLSIRRPKVKQLTALSAMDANSGQAEALSKMCDVLGSMIVDLPSGVVGSEVLGELDVDDLMSIVEAVFDAFFPQEGLAQTAAENAGQDTTSSPMATGSQSSPTTTISPLRD